MVRNHLNILTVDSMCLLVLDLNKNWSVRFARTVACLIRVEADPQSTTTTKFRENMVMAINPINIPILLINGSGKVFLLVCGEK